MIRRHLELLLPENDETLELAWDEQGPGIISRARQFKHKDLDTAADWAVQVNGEGSNVYVGAS